MNYLPASAAADGKDGNGLKLEETLFSVFLTLFVGVK